jgi:5,10-methylenetetrahydrofolate reductase
MGVMPLRDYRHAEFLKYEVPGMSLPDSIMERMLAAGENAAAAGQEIARELIQQLRSDARVRGVVLSSSVNQADELISLLEDDSRG